METESSSQKIASIFYPKNFKICAHCHTTKTSLWRNGPLGPKSMCNACGIRYQRRGMKKVQLEIKDDKGQKQRRSGTKKVQNQKRRVKTLTLGSKACNNKNKRSKKVELGVMMTSVDCQKELVRPKSQRHDDEVVKAAIQLMDLSSAARYLIN